MKKLTLFEFQGYRQYSRSMRSLFRQGLSPEIDPEPVDHDKFFSASMVIGSILLACLMLIASCQVAHAYTLDRWADAIKITEGNRYPYGIKEFGHITPFKARIICKRTIWHKWQNYSKLPLKTRQTIDFITYLGNRYCPYSTDPQGNINWKANMRAIL